MKLKFLICRFQIMQLKIVVSQKTIYLGTETNNGIISVTFFYILRIFSIIGESKGNKRSPDRLISKLIQCLTTALQDKTIIKMNRHIVLLHY